MALSLDLGVQVLPTTILFDAAGKEVWRYTGDLDWTGRRGTGAARRGRALVAQQLVDAGLAAGALVDALDDHRAGQARAAVLVAGSVPGTTTE